MLWTEDMGVLWGVGNNFLYFPILNLKIRKMLITFAKIMQMTSNLDKDKISCQVYPPFLDVPLIQIL